MCGRDAQTTLPRTMTVDRRCDPRSRLSLLRAVIVTITPEVREELLTAIPSLRAFAISLSGDADRADDLVQEALTPQTTGVTL